MHLIRIVKFFCVALVILLSLSACVDKKEQLSPLKIVCLGDSITYGHKLADPALQSYPGQLSQQAHGQWKVLNCGVNGATALNKGDIPITGLKAFQRAIRSQADVVVIMLGSNDTKNRNWQHVDGFVSNYVAMIRKFQRLPSSPHVIVCSIPPIFSDHANGISRERIAAVNVLVKKVAVRAKADYLNIFPLMSEKPSLFVDGIHPNSRGAQEIATLVFNKVASL